MKMNAELKINASMSMNKEIELKARMKMNEGMQMKVYCSDISSICQPKRI